MALGVLDTLSGSLLAREAALHGLSHRGKQKRLITSKLELDAKPACSVPLPPGAQPHATPFVAAYNKNPSLDGGHLLAVAGEEGYVSIVGTQHPGRMARNVLDRTWRPRAHWTCHRNSVFDLAWAKGDSTLYTASGDQCVGMWDTETARQLALAVGHEGSVKTVAPLTACEDVFATGSRDGKIMLWDARCSGQGVASGTSGRRRDTDGVPQLSAVCVLDAAHGTTGPVAAGRGSRALSRPHPITVTSLAFVPHSYVLASGGSHDTTVKLWDMRMQGLPLCNVEMPRQTAAAASGRGKAKAAAAAVAGPHEVVAATCPMRAGAAGITHIAIAPSGDRLLVSCLDSQYHLYSLTAIGHGAEPLATFTAPAPAFKGTFYMRAAFSPCGDYALCGSLDAGANIFSTCASAHGSRHVPLATLPVPHEVTGVAWCPSDPDQVATCSDGGSLDVWSLGWRLPEGSPGREGEGQGYPAGGASTRAAAVASTGPAARSANDAPPAAPVVTPIPNRPASARARNLVQQRLQLERTPRLPTAGPQQLPAPTAAAGAAATPEATAVVAQTAMLEPSPDLAALPGRRDLFTPGTAQPTPPAGSSTPGRAAALRRATPLPPVPAFSPAVKKWQQRRSGAEGPTSPQGRTDQAQTASAAAPEAAAAPQPATALPCPANNHSGLCGEEGHHGLAHFRARPPSPLLFSPDGDEHLKHGCLATDGATTGAAGGSPHSDLDLDARVVTPTRIRGSSGTPHQGAIATSTAMPPPPAATAAASAAPQRPSPFQWQLPPPPAPAPAAARAPAVCPLATPATFQRSRSRLGPFSPSRSTSTGSIGPVPGSSHSTASTSSSGGRSIYSSGALCTPRSGASTPRGAPQGVVHTILRSTGRSPRVSGGVVMASPRHGDEGATGAHHQRRLSASAGLGQEAALSFGHTVDLIAAGPGFTRRSPASDLFGARGPQEQSAGRNDPSGGRVLWGAGDLEQRETQQQGQHPRHPHTHRPVFQERLLSPRPHDEDVVNDDPYEHHLYGAGTAWGVPAHQQPPPPYAGLSPRAGGGGQVLLQSFQAVYDIADGESVEPALRYRQLHPEAHGPYDADADDEEAAATDTGNGSVAMALQGADVRGALMALAEPEGVDADAGWAVRRLSAHSGCGSDADDEDEDWEDDPYADKENHPPPEELPAPGDQAAITAPALPAPSASTSHAVPTESGAASLPVLMSPRAGEAPPTFLPPPPLPSQLLFPGSGVPPTPSRSVGSTQQQQQRSSGAVRFSPFAMGPPPPTPGAHRHMPPPPDLFAAPTPSSSAARAAACPMAAPTPSRSHAARSPVAAAWMGAMDESDSEEGQLGVEPSLAQDLAELPVAKLDFADEGAAGRQNQQDTGAGAKNGGAVHHGSTGDVDMPPTGSCGRRSYSGGHVPAAVAGVCSPGSPGHRRVGSAGCAALCAAAVACGNPTPSKRARVSRRGEDGGSAGPADADAAAGPAARDSYWSGARSPPREQIMRQDCFAGNVFAASLAAASGADAGMDSHWSEAQSPPRDQVVRQHPYAGTPDDDAQRFGVMATPTPFKRRCSDSSDDSQAAPGMRPAAEEPPTQRGGSFLFSPAVRPPQPSARPTGSHASQQRSQGMNPAVSRLVAAAAAVNPKPHPTASFDGSESPAPKMGTASRTGGRTASRAAEYLAAQEAPPGVVMSPFGFGALSVSDTPQGTPSAVGPATGPPKPQPSGSVGRRGHSQAETRSAFGAAGSIRGDATPMSGRVCSRLAALGMGAGDRIRPMGRLDGDEDEQQLQQDNQQQRRPGGPGAALAAALAMLSPGGSREPRDSMPPPPARPPRGAGTPAQAVPPGSATPSSGRRRPSIMQGGGQQEGGNIAGLVLRGQRDGAGGENCDFLEGGDEYDSNEGAWRRRLGEEELTVQCSLSSISCVLETQEPGCTFVPSTYPREEGGSGGRGSGSKRAVQGGAERQQMREQAMRGWVGQEGGSGGKPGWSGAGGEAAARGARGRAVPEGTDFANLRLRLQAERHGGAEGAGPGPNSLTWAFFGAADGAGHAQRRMAPDLDTNSRCINSDLSYSRDAADDMGLGARNGSFAFPSVGRPEGIPHMADDSSRAAAPSDAAHGLFGYPVDGSRPGEQQSQGSCLAGSNWHQASNGFCMDPQPQAEGDGSAGEAQGRAVALPFPPLPAWERGEEPRVGLNLPPPLALSGLRPAAGQRSAGPPAAAAAGAAPVGEHAGAVQGGVVAELGSKKPRQATLMQCWGGGGAPAAAAPPAAAPPRVLTSPRYYR